MWDIVGTLAFIALALVLAIESLRRWRASGRIVFLGAAAFSLLAALAFFFDWGPGFWILVFASLLRLLASTVGRRPAQG